MNVLHLLICLFGAPLISGVLISLAIRATSDTPLSPQITLKKAFTLVPEEGLAHQPPLWLGLTVPFFYFLIIGIYSWHPYGLSINDSGFKQFLSISTLPLAILAVCIPISVLVSRLHATQQTAMQIKTSRCKNNIDSFYSHRKALFEYFEKIGEIAFEGDIVGKFKAHPRLHFNAFRGSSPEQGMPAVYKDYFLTIENHLASVRYFSYCMIDEKDGIKLLGWYKSACDSTWPLAEMMILPEIFRDLIKKSKALKEPHQVGTRDAYTISVGTNHRELIGTYRYMLGYYRNLCEFSGYKSEFLERIDKDSSEMKMIESGRSYDKMQDSSIFNICFELGIAVEPI